MEIKADSLVEIIRKENERLLEGLLERLQPLIQPQAKREWWSPKQVADELGLADTETVRTWCKQKKIKAEWEEFGKRWKIPNSEVERIKANGDRP